MAKSAKIKKVEKDPKEQFSLPEKFIPDSNWQQDQIDRFSDLRVKLERHHVRK